MERGMERDKGGKTDVLFRGRSQSGRRFSGLKRFLSLSFKIKTIITVVLLIGVALYLYVVYDAARSLSVDDMNVESLVPTSSEGDYILTFSVTVTNPTSIHIDVDRLIYNVYIEDHFIGDGEKDFFSINPGVHDYTFSLSFSIWSLPTPVMEVVTSGGGNMRVDGKVTIPAKAFGIWTYTRITVPYSFTEPLPAPSSGEDGSGGLGYPPTPVVLSPPVYKTPDGAYLSWSMNNDLDFLRYEVHYSTTPDFTPSDSTLAGVVDDRRTTEYTVSGLEHLTTYYFKVRVWDSEGLYADSNEVSLWIP